jgi:hypothetical protein
MERIIISLPQYTGNTMYVTTTQVTDRPQHDYSSHLQSCLCPGFGAIPSLSKKRWRKRGGLARSWLGSVWSWAHLWGYGYAISSGHDKSSTTCTRYKIDCFTVVTLITYFLNLLSYKITHTHTHNLHKQFMMKHGCEGLYNHIHTSLYNHIHTSFLKVQFHSWTAKRITSLSLLISLHQKQGVGRGRCSSSQFKA